MAQGEMDEGSSQWDTARLDAAADHLDMMLQQVRSMRDTIPRMIDPLTNTKGSTQSRYATFGENSRVAVESVRALSRDMNSDLSRGIFDHANESRRAKPRGIRPPGLSRREEINGRKVASEPTIKATKPAPALLPDTSPSNMSDWPAVQSVLDEYTAAHPDIDIALASEEERRVRLILPSPARLHFEVYEDEDEDEDKNENENEEEPGTTKGQRVLRLRVDGLSHLASDISRATRRRFDHLPLRSALDIAYAYVDVMTRPCDGCGKLVGGAERSPPQVPVERIPVEKGDGQNPLWMAYHTGCAR